MPTASQLVRCRPATKAGDNQVTRSQTAPTGEHSVINCIVVRLMLGSSEPSFTSWKAYASEPDLLPLNNLKLAALNQTQGPLQRKHMAVLREVNFKGQSPTPSILLLFNSLLSCKHHANQETKLPVPLTDTSPPLLPRGNQCSELF